MLIYDNRCKYEKIMCLLIKVLASLTSESRIFFFFYFPKKMGRSGDGKRSIKSVWPWEDFSDECSFLQMIGVKRSDKGIRST